MQSILVKEMMIPLKDYAKVSEDATLNEAVNFVDCRPPSISSGDSGQGDYRNP
jgi:hypothetical protein